MTDSVTAVEYRSEFVQATFEVDASQSHVPAGWQPYYETPGEAILLFENGDRWMSLGQLAKSSGATSNHAARQGSNFTRHYLNRWWNDAEFGMILIARVTVVSKVITVEHTAATEEEALAKMIGSNWREGRIQRFNSNPRRIPVPPPKPRPPNIDRGGPSNP